MFGFLKKKEQGPTYAELVRQVQTPVLQNDENAPFRLKKNEKYIGSKKATLCLYKSDGRISYSGVTVSVPIVKGVRFRMGSGRVATGKSWQQDQSGTLHFTTDRIVFDGSNKNLTVRWNKIINFGFNGHEDGRTVKIDKDSGPDWVFKLTSPLPVEQMATIVMVEENRL